MRGRVLFWAEAVTAVLSGFTFLLTVLRRDWIEHFFGIDPDAGSGTLEWLIAAGLFAAAAALGLLARRQWRRLVVAR